MFRAKIRAANWLIFLTKDIAKLQELYSLDYCVILELIKTKFPLIETVAKLAHNLHPKNPK